MIVFWNGKERRPKGCPGISSPGQQKFRRLFGLEAIIGTLAAPGGVSDRKARQGSIRGVGLEEPVTGIAIAEPDRGALFPVTRTAPFDQGDLGGVVELRAIGGEAVAVGRGSAPPPARRRPCPW